MDFESSFVDLRLFQENQPLGISWHCLYIASRHCAFIRTAKEIRHVASDTEAKTFNWRASLFQIALKTAKRQGQTW